MQSAAFWNIYFDRHPKAAAGCGRGRVTFEENALGGLASGETEILEKFAGVLLRFEMDAVIDLARVLRANHHVSEIGYEPEVFAFARRDRSLRIIRDVRPLVCARNRIWKQWTRRDDRENRREHERARRARQQEALSGRV